MKLFRGTISNNHIDSHGEVMSVGALKSLVESVSKHWIPVGIEHDPRIPPIGRIREAELRAEPDGSTSVIGTMEIFEPGDALELAESERRLPVTVNDSGGVRILFDRAFRDAASQAIIRELADAFGTKPRQDLKKAVDSVAILTIVGSFIAVSAASGFFGEIGSDLYHLLKERIKALFRAKESVPERLLVIRLAISGGDSAVDVQIILTNPTPEDLDLLFEVGPAQLVLLLNTLGLLSPTIDRLVCSFSRGTLTLEFAVRQDAVPLTFR